VKNATSRGASRQIACKKFVSAFFVKLQIYWFSTFKG
jgi:hypothetical protein